MSLFLVGRVKQLCFLSLEDCEENGYPISPLVFKVTHRKPPSGIRTHVFLSSLTRCISGG